MEPAVEQVEAEPVERVEGELVEQVEVKATPRLDVLRVVCLVNGSLRLPCLAECSLIFFC